MKTVTIDNLDDVTAQEVFDFIVSSLLKQGEKCLDAFCVCAMRGVNDTRCAAGFLVPDDKYSEDMEMLSWSELVDEFKISENHMGLIASLQVVHDAHDVSDWDDHFGYVAGNHNLNTEVLS